MPNYIGYNIYICKISIILLRVYLLVIYLQCNIMWKQVFFISWIVYYLFIENFSTETFTFTYLRDLMDDFSFKYIHCLVRSLIQDIRSLCKCNARRKIFVCIKIRSLFNIRKEEEKSFYQKSLIHHPLKHWIVREIFRENLSKCETTCHY